MEMYAAVIGVCAVLFSPVLFYLMLGWCIEKMGETPGKPAVRSLTSDRRTDLKQARRALRILIEKRRPA